MGRVNIIYVPMWQGGADLGVGTYGFSAYNFAILIQDEESPTLNNIKNKNLVLQHTSKVYLQVEHLQKFKTLPLLIGGDHSLSLGSISAARKANHNLGVIYIDAHADMNTPETTTSMNAHGMTLAALLGEGDKDFVNFAYKGQKIKPENLVLFGIRDLDPGEVAFIKKHNIFLLTYEEIKEIGISTALRKVQEYFNSRITDVHISFDLDVMDPVLIPGVSVPVAKGFEEDEAFHIVQRLLNEYNVTSFDIVEYNPAKDVDNKTFNFMTSLIKVIKANYK